MGSGRPEGVFGNTLGNKITPMQEEVVETPQTPPKEQEETNNQENAQQTQSQPNNPYEHFKKTIKKESQEHHIPGSNHYIPGRSIFNGTVEEAQRLVNEYSGKGEYVTPNKERVDFGQVIGVFRNENGSTVCETTVGNIHYSKAGTHIVPANPLQGDN